MRRPSRDLVTGFVVLGTTIIVIAGLFLVYVDGMRNGMQHLP
ncbi:hypothetical protein [Streptacidiphilus albus]|nr:hypothetical protein [Streptacidiphilus albus]